ncbi:acetate and sugar kinases/Hsc70/actin family protein [Tellurirhabdus bombi]|uniref:hypothetical protein n=1 Tax=Tellurirhabdus bombi TaxID=2907205 RepID=UPI001F3F695F|nr:hypothetical protein [Tellurirhabdus bombi]
MQRLTVAGRLLITLLILAGIYFGLRTFGGIDLLKSLQGKPNTEQADATATDTESPDLATAEETGNSSEASSSASPNVATADRPTFNFTPPAPQNGKLKGVVELGASGFNSFIIRVDEQKNWKLEKADFGNSLVLENMATDLDIREGLKKYIAEMLNFGVSGRDIHFVVSSGAVKAENTQKIIKALKSLNYFVNTVTAEQEGRLALRSVLPDDYKDKAFVVDIGSGNTKISWVNGGQTKALESYGAKYFQEGTTDSKVYDAVKAEATKVPEANRKTCFIIGGVPFELAKQVRNGKERYTVLNTPANYKGDNAKNKAGLNIYKAIADATGCDQFVFDWDANFTIGYLLTLK